MTFNKCPLCGSRVTNGFCSDCGYEIPDEASIAAPYNYDPSDYNYDSEKYVTVNLRKDPAAAMPEIKVYEDKHPEKAAPKNEQYMDEVNPYSGAVPKPKVTLKKEVPPQNVNPYANFNPAENTNKSASGFSGKFEEILRKLSKKHLKQVIIGLLLIFANPVLGIASMIWFKHDNKANQDDESYKLAWSILIVAFVLRLFIAFWI
jgi:hypothetical protein